MTTDSAPTGKPFDALQAARDSMEIPVWTAPEAALRKLLWIRHGCPVSALYGDDGELQCHACGLDFLRNTVEEIEAVWYRKALAAFASGVPSRVSPALSAEQETELRAIRERAEAATPGPWSLGGIFFVGAGETKRNVWGATPEGAQSGAVVAPQVSPPDSDFIAHARSDVPRLLAIIAELTTHLRTQAE